MPRFIKASDIPMKQRAPHLNRYRRQLRDALLNPAITSEQRARIKKKLDMVGKPKIYTGNPPSTSPRSSRASIPPSVESEIVTPSVEAATPPLDTTPVTEEPEAPQGPEETLEDLLVLSKGELLAKAADEGVEVFKSWNKDEIAEALLDHSATKA